MKYISNLLGIFLNANAKTLEPVLPASIITAYTGSDGCCFIETLSTSDLYIKV